MNDAAQVKDGIPWPIGPAARGWRFVAASLSSLLAIACLSTSASAQAGALEGHARVVDGDTLQIRDQRVRLWGVDAPDAQQICQLDGKPWTCGEAARLALSEYVAHRTVSCEVLTPRSSDADQRARCDIDGDDLNRWVVQQGWALDDEPRGHRTYAQTETRAALEGRGLWQGSFVEPWQWQAPTLDAVSYGSSE